MRRCLSRFPWNLNISPQSSHLYVRFHSSMYPRWRLLRWLFLVNTSHSHQSVQLDFTMYAPMPFQVPLEPKHLPTVITPVRFHSTMYPTMNFKIAVLGKRLPAVLTSVRSQSHSTMYEEMSFQTAVGSKCLPTVVTRVWLIASAPPTVNYHVAPF